MLNIFCNRCSIVLILVLYLGLVGCGHEQKPAGTSSIAALPAVDVIIVQRGTIDRFLTGAGTLSALQDQEATVSPQVTGILDRLFIRYGSQVSVHQVIGHITAAAIAGQIQQANSAVGQAQVQVQQAEANSLQQEAQTRTSILQAAAALRGAQASLAGAQATQTGNMASLTNARHTLDREKQLFIDGLVSQKDVDSAELEIRTAQAVVDAQNQAIDSQVQTVAQQEQSVEAARAAGVQILVKRKDVQIAQQQVKNAEGARQTAEAQLAFYTLRAPLSGQVTQIGATTGESVDLTTKIVTIANLDRLQLQVGVPISEVGLIQPAQSIYFTVDSLPGKTFRSVIRIISSKVDTSNGTVSVICPIINPHSILRDDTSAKARILIDRHDNAIIVPAGAVLTDPATGKQMVVVVSSDDIAHVVPVQTGLAAADVVEVTSGLQPNSRVVISGQYGLPDSTHVLPTLHPFSVQENIPAAIDVTDTSLRAQRPAQNGN